MKFGIILSWQKIKDCMKKRIMSILLVIGMCSIGFTSYADDQPTLIKGYATAYNGPTDTTCTGKPVHKGICGGCQAYIGKTIILYQRLPGDEVGFLAYMNVRTQAPVQTDSERAES